MHALQAAGLDEISIPEELLQRRVDLRPFMQRHAFTVNEHVSLSRAYRLFRTMGLRHLFVTAEAQPTVVGCITRKDIIEEHAELVLGEKRGASGSAVSLIPLSSSLELVDAHAPPVSSRPDDVDGSV
jgi:CBS-domain-containing membrane protein